MCLTNIFYFKFIGMNISVARISRKTKIVDNGRLQYLRS